MDPGKDAGHAGIKFGIDGKGQGQQILRQGPHGGLDVGLVAGAVCLKKRLVVLKGQLQQKLIGVFVEALEGLFHRLVSLLGLGWGGGVAPLGQLGKHQRSQDQKAAHRHAACEGFS